MLKGLLLRKIVGPYQRIGTWKKMHKAHALFFLLPMIPLAQHFSVVVQWTIHNVLWEGWYLTHWIISSILDRFRTRIILYHLLSSSFFYYLQYYSLQFWEISCLYRDLSMQRELEYLHCSKLLRHIRNGLSQSSHPWSGKQHVWQMRCVQAKLFDIF